MFKEQKFEAWYMAFSGFIQFGIPIEFYFCMVVFGFFLGALLIA
jgi:hypothetical protein